MAAPLELDEVLITCPVCLEIYDDPRQLSCGHSFCRKCLDDILNTKQNKSLRCITCPQCIQESTVDETGAAGLTKNYTLANIVGGYWETEEKKRAAVVCSVCEMDRRTAVKRCQDCRIDYCQECLQQYHPYKGIFKKHVLTEPVSRKHVTEPVSRSTPTSDPLFQVPILQMVQPLNSIDFTTLVEVKWNPCRGVLSYELCCINIDWGDTNRGSEEVVVRGLRDEDAEAYQVGGLRHETEYIITVTAIYPGNDSVASEPVSCKTKCRIECTRMYYSDDGRHNNINVAEGRGTVSNGIFQRSFQKQKRYKNMFGIGADCYFPKPFQLPVYWEQHLAIVNHEGKDNEKVANIGVVEFGKGDNTSTMTNNPNCLCCSIYSVPGTCKLAVEFWDGIKTEKQAENILDHHTEDNHSILHLGFFIHQGHKRFTVIDTIGNVVLHTFEKTGEELQPIVELFQNPVQNVVSVSIISERLIEKLPNVLLKFQ